MIIISDIYIYFSLHAIHMLSESYHKNVHRVQQDLTSPLMEIQIQYGVVLKN